MTVNVKWDASDESMDWNFGDYSEGDIRNEYVTLTIRGESGSTLEIEGA